MQENNERWLQKKTGNSNNIFIEYMFCYGMFNYHLGHIPARKMK